MSEQIEYTYDLFISYADADRAWVEGYLLDVLTQAGARCHSEAAFDLGVPRVLEFERAVQQSQRILLVLSPATLAEGFNQFADLLAQSYGLETATWPVIPLILQPVELPPRLAMLTALDATDPGNWEAVVERLCAELQRPVPGPAPRPPCPYPGMVPFSEADRDRFFGRDDEVQELLERLRLHPFLTVIGPSGSGKSSLVFAGLVPALRESGLFGPGGWLVRTLRPGEAPLAALAVALDGDATNLAQAVTDLLRTVRSDDFSRPGPAATEVATTNNRLLLVADQFEELFTLARSDVELFQQALLRLAEIPDCYVVLTVRADFYPDLMAAPLWREIQAHRFEALPLDENGLREAVVRPAEGAGVFVETALVERLVADAGREPGVLPLVQETLVLLWERVERRFLPLRAYEALVLPRAAYGAPERTGLQVAMARRADAALAGLTLEQQAIARRIFLRLVQFGEGRADTRRQQPVAALRVTGEESRLFDQTLYHLTDNRLLTLSGEEEGAARQVDIAHESLIDGWPALQEWLTERREAELTRRRLESKAAEWVRLGRDSGGLLDEVELLEAERWLASPDAADLGYGEALSAVVEASRAAIEAAGRARERRRRRTILGLAVGLVVVLILLALTVFQWRAATTMGNERATAVAVSSTAQAEAEQNAIVSLARQLVAQAKSEWDGRGTQRREPSLLLAAQSVELHYTAEAAEWLDDSLRYMPFLVHQIESEGLREPIVFSPDGRWVAAVRPDNRIHLWALPGGEEAQVAPMAHEDDITALAFTAGGSTIVSGSRDGTARLWEVATGKERREARMEHEDAVVSVRVSPQGRWVASTEKAGSELPSYGGVLYLWEAASGSEEWRIEYDGPVVPVEFSPDERRLVVLHMCGDFLRTSCPTVVQVLDATTGEEVARKEYERKLGPRQVDLSPDGQWVASGGDDGAVRVWETETGDDVAIMEHGTQVTAVAFHPRESVVLSGDAEGALRLWDANTEELMWEKSLPDQVWTVAFDPGGTWIISGDSGGTTRLWRVSVVRYRNRPTRLAFTEHTRIEGLDESFAFDPKGQWVAMVPVLVAESQRVSPVVSIWKPAIPWQVMTRWSTDDVSAIAPSQDGAQAAFVGGRGGSIGKMGLVDLGGGAVNRAVSFERQDCWALLAVALSPDGSWLAAGGEPDPSARCLAELDEALSAGQVWVWDTEGWLEMAQLPHEARVTALAASSDGRLLHSGTMTGTLQTWDVYRGVEVSRYELGGAVAAIAWPWVAVHDQYEVAVWDAEQERFLVGVERVTERRPSGGLEIITLGAVGQVALSADGQWLASSYDDGVVQVWEVASGEAKSEIRPEGRVTALALSTDGRWLASTSSWSPGDRADEALLQIWEAATGQEVSRWRLDREVSGAGVPAMAFTPDGKRLLWGNRQAAGTWHWLPDDLVNATCERLTRNLTWDEWRRYLPDEPYRCTCPNLPPGEGAPPDACVDTD